LAAFSLHGGQQRVLSSPDKRWVETLSFGLFFSGSAPTHAEQGLPFHKNQSAPAPPNNGQ